MQKFSFIQQDNNNKSSNTKGIQIKQAGIYDDNDPKYKKFIDQQNNLQNQSYYQQPGRNDKQKIFDTQPNQKIEFTENLILNASIIHNDQFFPPDNDKPTSLINYLLQQSKETKSQCEVCNYLENPKSDNDNKIKNILYQIVTNQLQQQNSIILCQCGKKLRTIQLKEIKDEIFYTQLMQNQIEVIKNGPLKGLIFECKNQVCDYFCILNEKSNNPNQIKCPVCFSYMK